MFILNVEMLIQTLWIELIFQLIRGDRQFL